MKKVFSGIVVLLVILCCSYGFASDFQFEGYYWGEVKEEVANSLKSNNKQILESQANNQISYKDSLYESPCTVTMIFTIEEHELAKVVIKWYTGQIGDDVQKVLINKYGQPSQINEYMKHYEWTGGFSGQKLVFDYYTLATLSFYGGQYYEKFERQLNSQAESEF